MNSLPHIPMVDLKTQYERLKPAIDEAMQQTIEASAFIKGPALSAFEENLATYLNVKHVIGVANGTDALQIALMALDLQPGDEVIIPSFTYAATAEVVCLLGLTPVFVDVNDASFNMDINKVEEAITPRTKVIMVVHLFGQSAEMGAIKQIAKKHSLRIVEDNAQAIGCAYISDGHSQKTGAIGDIGCTSFFPSKNLGCFGDGGAVMTNDDHLADRIRKISNHGQTQKYIHTVVGVNSRLDTLQAAILDVKLSHLNDFIQRRRKLAAIYDEAFAEIEGVEIPARNESQSPHTFHQYVLKIEKSDRDALQAFLVSQNIGSSIYYPLALHEQEAYKNMGRSHKCTVSEQLCKQVIALPMHTEMHDTSATRVIEAVKAFYKGIK